MQIIIVRGICCHGLRRLQKVVNISAQGGVLLEMTGQKLTGLKKLTPYLLNHKLSLLVIFAASLLNAVVSLIPILFIGGIVDVLTGGASKVMNWLPFLADDLSSYVIGFAVTYFLQSAVSIFSGYFISIFTTKIIDEVRQDAFSWSLHSFKPHRETKKASDAVSRITGDVEAIMRALAGPLNGLLPLLLKLVGSLIILTLWSRTIALVAAALMILIYIASLAIARRAKKIAKEQRVAQADLLGATTDALYNIPIIKIFRSEKYESRNYQPYSKRIRELFKTLELSFSTYWVVVQLLMGLGYTVTLILTIKNIKLGLLSAGALPIAYSYMANILSPMVSVSRYQNDLYQADAAITRVFQLQEGFEEIDVRPLPFSSDEGFTVEFQDVSIECNASTRLKGLSFKADRNNLLVLVGASGQGKSTIIQALLSNHSLKSGRILVNNFDLQDLKKSIYPYIGVSFQDGFLFERSLKDNIVYGAGEYDKDRFYSTCRLLGIGSLLEERGEDYNVGLQGKNLSGGEKKRVSLARALCGGPKALYIFDEPTAELDSENRGQVIELIGKLKQQGTVIITTHDEDFLAIADTVVDLNRYLGAD